MNITVIGSGYVGTTLAACLADIGHEVAAIDIDDTVVERLADGEPPVSEPGLNDLVSTHIDNRLRATSSYEAVHEADVTFLAVGTPSRPDGSIDLSGIRSAAEALGKSLAAIETNERHLVVVKSTITPAGVADVRSALHDGLNGADETVELATNPEFLREGSAISDFLNPDKLVFGTNSSRASDTLRRLYEPLVADRNIPIVDTDTKTAMMIKYANNAVLASKISLANDIGNVCKEFDIDAYEVMEAVGLDDRISERFLRSGVGWGGSCFGKDVEALISTARDEGYTPRLLEAAVEVNAHQPTRLLKLLDDHADVTDEQVAVLGLAFKPGTDDVRNSRAIPVIEGLLNKGADVIAYDPIATDNMRDRFPDIEYADSVTDALAGAVAAVVVTGWKEFAAIDEEFDEMDEAVVIDGRRIVEPTDSLIYDGLTW